MTNDQATLTRDELLESARTFFQAKRGIAPDRIQFDSQFEELDIDSLDLAELRMELEEKYDLLIETDSLLEVATVGDVIDLVLAEAVPATA